MRLIFWRVVLDYSLIAIIASLVASDPDHLSLIVSHLGDYSSSLFNCFYEALFHNSIISLFKTMLVLRVYPCKDVYRLICIVRISSQGCIPLDTQYLVCCIKLSFSLLWGFVLYPNIKSYLSILLDATFSRFIRVTYSWTAFSRFIPYKITYSRTFVLPSHNGQTRPLVVDCLRLISIHFTIQFMSIYSIYSLILPPIGFSGMQRRSSSPRTISVGGRDGVV